MENYFIDNGFDPRQVKRVIKEYKPAAITNPPPPPSPETVLSRLSPTAAHPSRQQQNEKRITFASISYVPSINNQLKRAFFSNNVDFRFKPGPKLGNLLSGLNNTRPSSFDQKGVYQLKCSCNSERTYIGQMRVSFRTTRMGQHCNDVTSTKFENHISGISKHARECSSGAINWDEPTIITTVNDKSKATLQRNLVRESLEICKQKTTRALGLNDPQLCVRSNAWDPILEKLKPFSVCRFVMRRGRGRVCVCLSLIPLFPSAW